jgi:lysylphosphatidylglycerol synthetase-like protein (DUF2156 family)
MGWVVLLPTAAVWWVVHKKVNPRGRGASSVSILTMLLAAVAGCGLAYTFAGRWVAAFVAWVGQVLANITGESGIASGAAVAVTLLVFLFAVADIAYDRRADRGAQFSAFLMPTLLALVIGGSLGETGGGAVQEVTTNVAAFMSQIGGA